MELYAKKRLVIVIESLALKLLLKRLDELAVPGYTAQPALAGRGRSGSWQRDGMISDASVMTVVSLILDETRLDEVLSGVFDIVKQQIGIVTVTDVQVIRPDHF